jgi:hypothetical protein
MNFIPGKIQYDASSEIFWVRMAYSVEGREAAVLAGATKAYLYDIFKQPTGTEFGSGFLNKWQKIAMRDLTASLPRINTGEVYRKMYGTSPAEIEKGMAFLLDAETKYNESISI